ncbi:hypothetical protein FA15DRAFT_708135 [Coprinopsis marcescibilis]|uniref:F-box domain-containing protein n=1 Tax=Coprinopsis marcescibilis TaxID=230819 RepID=A0A5C3KWT1_COPMA|nr:hypothetical protein FA15DRAFT_708135 [Coprinopsis marcescibilis]
MAPSLTWLTWPPGFWFRPAPPRKTATRLFHLPPELIRHIIGFLEDDEQALRATSLVASAFRRPAQEILFSELLLEPPYPAPKHFAPGEKLLSLFEQSPEIAGYVRSIFILDTPLLAYESASWVCNDVQLPEALGRVSLDKIQAFTLHQGRRYSWSVLSAPMKDTILAICNSPSLVSLSIAGPPIDIIHVCRPSLKNLDIGNGTPHRLSNISTSMQRNASLKLQSLSLVRDHDVHEAVDYILNPFNRIDVGELETLCVFASEIEDHDAMSSLLTECAASLHALTFQPASNIAAHYITNEENPFTLTGLVNLRRLTICYQHVFVDANNVDDPLPWVVDLLRTMQAPNILESVHLFVNHDFADADTHEPQRAEGWRELHSLLVDRKRFPALQHADIELGSHNLDIDEIYDRVEGFLPDLDSIGLVRLKKMSSGLCGPDSVC